MADHLSLGELRVAGDITPIGTLDTNPPPGRPLQALADYLGPSSAPHPLAPQRGWETIFKGPGMNG